MGSNCSADEREFRYLTFHQAIYAIDNDIKKEISNTDISNKKYLLFGLVNQGLFKKYKFLSNENFDKNEARKTKFDYKDLIKKNFDLDFRYIHKEFKFFFPTNFIFIYEDFMSVIRDYVDKEYKRHLSTIFKVIIGGNCLIMKDAKDEKDEYPFRYIILYSELKENKGNEIDFFLYFKDKKDRLAADEFIIKENLWNYFKKLKFDYKDEYKKILNEKKREIGYAVRCCSVEKIESYISKFNKKEISNSVNLSQNNFSNNFTNEIIQNNKNNINLSLNPNINISNKDNNANLPEQKSNIMNNQNNVQNLNINIIQNLNLEITNLKNENNELKSKEKLQSKEITNLNNEIIELKNKEKLQSKEITNLKNEINESKNNKKTQPEEITNLKNEINNLKKENQLKEEENKKLKSKIDLLINQKDKKPNLVDIDNIKVIQFISTDHSIIYPIKCLPSDTFAEVEEKLYKIYPEYRETNNSFQVDGRTILRFKTIAENNIQEGHCVQITKIE